MLLFHMQEPSENPFAAPSADADADPHLSISRRMPVDTYFYVGIVFCLGAFAGSFVGSIFMYYLPPLAAIAVLATASCLSGFFAASRMYRRLADIHERKVAWEIQQSEWANGIG